MYLEMTLPTSRYIVPGLHISMAFCRHSQDLATRNLLDSATSPTRQVQLRSTCTPSLYTVTSRLMMSPFQRGLLSGIPWQITQFTDVHRDFGNLQQFSGDGYALFSMMKLCTASSMESVVTPTFTKECPKSRVFRAKTATSLSFAISSSLLTQMVFCNLDSCYFLGIEVQKQSGLGMCSGTSRLLDMRPGLRGPVNLKPSLRFFCVSSLGMWTSLCTAQVFLKHYWLQKQQGQSSICLQVGHIMAAFLPQPGVQQTKLVLYMLNQQQNHQQQNQGTRNLLLGCAAQLWNGVELWNELAEICDLGKPSRLNQSGRESPLNCTFLMNGYSLDRLITPDQIKVMIQECYILRCCIH